MLKDVFKDRSTIMLLLFSVFCVGLLAVRFAFAKNFTYFFLLWNLFLAFIPWIISSLIFAYKIHNRLVLVALAFVWLVFFPNAPYILTDLIHLGIDKRMPLWFEVVLLLSFGLCGTLFGFVSLNHFHNIIRQKLSQIFTTSIVIILIYLAGFAIYLGRFLRWNSWDLLTNINGIVGDTYEEITNPTTSLKLIGFILIFGTLLNVLYWSFRSFNRPSAPERT